MSSVPDPTTWATGDDSITPKQTDFLKKLCEEHGVQFDPAWSKGEASAKIDELKNTGVVDASKGAVPAAEAPADATHDSTHLSNPQKWTTGHEDATDKQKRYIAAMATKGGEHPNEGQGLTKTEASEKIEALKEKTGM